MIADSMFAFNYSKSTTATESSSSRIAKLGCMTESWLFREPLSRYRLLGFKSSEHVNECKLTQGYQQLTGRFDRELIDALPQSLRFISHNGAGYDQIDASACADKGRPRDLFGRSCIDFSFNVGISVSNTPGAVDACTANTAIFLLLGAMRRVHIPATSLRAGQWRGEMSLGHDPDGKILGILGMGGIGSAVARRALAFGFKLQYHNRSPLSPERNPWGAVYVDFETLLRTSDVISVHLPLEEKTRGMIGGKEFEIMKNGVVLVNTARGAIIDEQALVGALRSGKVFGAGLDVYEKEPEVSKDLLDNENVVLLPHLGTATVETQVC